MSYDSLKLPKPDLFTNSCASGSALIILSGHSTRDIVQYKNQLRDKFDVIIGANFAFMDFEYELDYHIILEKNPVKIINTLKTYRYRKDLPRVLNWKGIDKFPSDMNLYKATRCNFNGKPDITKYSKNGEEGLLIGPQGDKGLSVGTVGLNALHFACILGCTRVYLIGADLLFRDEFDHYYKDRHYRDSTTKAKNRSPIVEVQHKGKRYKTTKFFEESARYIDKVIKKICNPKGIAVYDFSDGLINKAVDLDLDKFFKEQK